MILSSQNGCTFLHGFLTSLGVLRWEPILVITSPHLTYIRGHWKMEHLGRVCRPVDT